MHRILFSVVKSVNTFLQSQGSLVIIVTFQKELSTSDGKCKLKCGLPAKAAVTLWIVCGFIT